MQTVAKTSFLLTDSSSIVQVDDAQKTISQGGFYQQLVMALTKAAWTTRVSSTLGDNLLALAEYSYERRQMETVGQISHFLLNADLLNADLSHQHRSIGLYYQALYLGRRMEFSQAGRLYEYVIEKAPAKYRTKALMSLGAIKFDSGDYKSALALYLQANRAAVSDWGRDPLVAVHTQKMIAVLKSMDEDHEGALIHLEKMFPLVCAVGRRHPHVYYDYLNSLAVELAEVGRLEEAFSASKIALASPYANAYPEWHETRNEIICKGRRASHSVVALSQRDFEVNNILRLPAQNFVNSFGPGETGIGSPQKPGRILDYLEWKKKMAKESNSPAQNQSSSQELDHRQMMLKIIQLISDESLTKNDLSAMLSAVEKIAQKRKMKN